ncbi:SlyX protein [Gemmobacter caeni]|jgi:SlyX protein|uniref:SlyX protein n=1 Tax=Gemmobacter caeni TaxID=589035 RepID=A0A2T6B4U5_9RHOB|nr:SlyX family protein [Gemmobacter caeni]PTX51096.1 SlyX protein [Gemmobacter caeni]TWJ01096.1 SlyX protein [Gemmobacter caeni]
MDRITTLEEQLAHLARMVEDLSDIVVRQSREMDIMARRIGLLMEREAEREAEGGSIPLADQKPPHW